MHQRAVLAGGCFWGMQDLIRQLPGVVSTRVGYTGGDTPNATYRNHGTHAEGIEIVFDTAETSYRRILEYFFQIHDPTTRNRQGNDIGTSYRSAIFYTSDEQRKVAEETIADVNASGLWPGKVVTEVKFARLVWGFSCQVVVLVCSRFFVRSGKAVLRPVACDQIRGARGRCQGTEMLAQLSGLPLSVACASQRLDAWHAEG